ncbi:hypothetical protein Pelo_16547 [Pelomyxa schiedti]|nr:hypothetical protein Pelo_16547 [Pelomyxa schiedti]
MQQQQPAVPHRDVIDLTLDDDEDSPHRVALVSATPTPTVTPPIRAPTSIATPERTQPNQAEPMRDEPSPFPSRAPTTNETGPLSESVAAFPQLLAENVTHNALSNALTSEFIRTGFFSAQDIGISNRPQKPSPNPKLITEITSGIPQDAASTTERQRPPPNELPQDGGSGLRTLLPIFMTHIEQTRAFTSQITKEREAELKLCRGLFGHLESTLLLLEDTEKKRKQIQEANARATAAKRALIDQHKAELQQLQQKGQQIKDDIRAVPDQVVNDLKELAQKKP